jgi:AcrR family transcriptional regulator
MSMRSEENRMVLRDKLLTIAIEMVSLKGLEGLQARVLAQAADCAVGTIYNLFDGLDGLILAVNTHTLQDLEQHMRQAGLDDQSPCVPRGSKPNRLAVLAHAYLAFANRHEKAWRAVFDHRLPEGRPLPQDYLETREQLFVTLEKALLDFPALPDDPALRKTTARALWSAVHGIVFLAFSGSLGPIDRAETQALVDVIAQAAEKAYGPS